jgi:hypothetical protein
VYRWEFGVGMLCVVEKFLLAGEIDSERRKAWIE